MAAVVGNVLDVQVPTDAGAGPDNRVRVLFDGNRTVFLDRANPNFGAFVELLVDLQREGIPARVFEVNDLVEELSIPLIVKVRALSELEAGDIGVDLQPSHARHTLLASQPDFARLRAALEEVRKTGNFVAVTETASHEILDVSPTPPPADDWSGLPTGEDVVADFHFPDHLAAGLTLVTEEQARALFDAMKSHGCPPNAIAGFCIPFLYPDDGCHARAHRMCELLLREHEVDAGKIWLFGRPAPATVSLHVTTHNHPDCPGFRLPWRYHVAPFLKVEIAGQAEPRVVDPALFGQIVSPETWKEAQGDPHARFSFTEAAIWDRPEPGVIRRDETFSKTPRDLVSYRLALKARVRASGAPPYC